MPGEIQRQYIGARYVPLLAEPLAWSIDSTYDYLTMVVNNQVSYISRKNVPAGTEITNVEYWAEIGSYDAHIAQLHDQLTELKDNTEFQFQRTDTLINVVDSYSKNHLNWLEKGEMPFFNGNLIVLHHGEVTGITAKLQTLFSPTKTWTQTTTANIGWNTSNSFLSQLEAIAARADFVRTKATNVFIFYGTTDKISEAYIPYRNTIAYLHSLLKCKIYIIKSGWNPTKNAIESTHDVNDYDTHWLLSAFLSPWSLGASYNVQYTDEMINNLIAMIEAKFISGRETYAQGAPINLRNTSLSSDGWAVRIRAFNDSVNAIDINLCVADSSAPLAPNAKPILTWPVEGYSSIALEVGFIELRVEGSAPDGSTIKLISSGSLELFNSAIKINVLGGFGNQHQLQSPRYIILPNHMNLSML